MTLEAPSARRATCAWLNYLVVESRGLGICKHGRGRETKKWPSTEPTNICRKSPMRRFL